MRDFNPTLKLKEFFKWYAEVILEQPHQNYKQEDFGKDVLGVAKSTTNAYFTGQERTLPKKYYPVLSKILNKHGLPNFEQWEGYESLDEIEGATKEDLKNRRKRIASVVNEIIKNTKYSRHQFGKMFVGHYLKPDQFVNGIVQGRFNTERILPVLYKLKLSLDGREGYWVANPHYIEGIRDTSAMFIPKGGDQLAALLESPEVLKTLHEKAKAAQLLLSEVEGLTAQLIK